MNTHFVFQKSYHGSSFLDMRELEEKMKSNGYVEEVLSPTSTC